MNGKEMPNRNWLVYRGLMNRFASGGKNERENDADSDHFQRIFSSNVKEREWLPDFSDNGISRSTATGRHTGNSCVQMM